MAPANVCRSLRSRPRVPQHCKQRGQANPTGHVQPWTCPFFVADDEFAAHAHVHVVSHTCSFVQPSGGIRSTALDRHVEGAVHLQLPWPRIDASARAPPCRGPQVSKRQAWRTKASRIPRAPPAPAPTTSARFGRTWTFHRGAGTMEVPSTWTWNEDGPPPTWHRGRMDTMWKTGPTHQPTDPRHGGSKHETRPNVPCSIPKTRGAARHRGIVRPSNGAGTRPPHS
mmetsp:Transcript_10555/g.64863  ORF Transcript_10555/g.64863 Transcript_10555/m.64863 type:complete len:226 (-) Transcript_10555:1598-2275(-)